MPESTKLIFQVYITPCGSA